MISRRGHDWPGAALATIALGGFVFALIESNTVGCAAPSVVTSLAVGFVALVAFVVAEGRHPYPMVPLELFRSSAIAAWVLIEGKKGGRRRESRRGVRAATALRSVSLVTLLSLVASTAASAAAPDEDRALSIAREFERQARQRTLWPGFEPLTIPLAIYTGERTYLFRHPSPPAGFSPLGGSQPAAFAYEGRHPAVTSNSSYEIGGILAATLLADGERAKRSPSTLAATAMHESFHVFQRQHHSGWSGNEGSIFLYPSDDTRLLGLRRLETAALRQALAARTVPATACWTRKALDYRRERFATMDSSFARYERLTELNEGLATYVELLALGKATVEIPAREFPATAFRDRLYATGPALAFLLDRLRPGWQAELETDDRQFLDRMLETASERQVERRDDSCSMPPEEIDRIRTQANVDAATVVATRATRRRDFDALPGWRVVIEANGDEPLWPQGFDPLNVERVDGGLVHARFLKLGNGAGDLSMLDEQGADLEAFTEAAGEHPLFSGVRSVTIAGLAKPEVETTPGQIAIRAPGFSATFRGATAETRGEQIVVRWNPTK
jgi:hypothetical protein